MTTFINKGDIGYKPFGPQPIHIISNAGPIANPVEKDGLFYNQPERRHALIETVTDYQEWAEEGWKQQHGTYEAAKRFLAKLQEEVGEVETAYISFITNGSMPDSKEGSEFLSELGDVLWCATALASNSSSDIDSAFKLRLYDYAMGVSVAGSKGDLEVPSWQKAAADLATSRVDLSLSQVDDFIEIGFEPLPSTSMNIEKDEQNSSTEGHIRFLQMLSLGISAYIEKQYAYGEDEIILPLEYDRIAKDIGVIVSEIYMHVAYIAHYKLESTLTGIVSKNIDKLTARIEAGRVDKMDGIRDPELL